MGEEGQGRERVRGNMDSGGVDHVLESLVHTYAHTVAAVMNRFQDAIKLGVRSVDALQLLLHLIDIVPESRSVRWPVRQ